MCPGLHSIECMPISIGAEKCPLTLIVNFTITSGQKYGQKGHKVSCQFCSSEGNAVIPNLTLHKETDTNANPNVKKKSLLKDLDT